MGKVFAVFFLLVVFLFVLFSHLNKGQISREGHELRTPAMSGWFE